MRPCNARYRHRGSPPTMLTSMKAHQRRHCRRPPHRRAVPRAGRGARIRPRYPTSGGATPGRSSDRRGEAGLLGPIQPVFGIVKRGRVIGGFLSPTYETLFPPGHSHLDARATRRRRFNMVSYYARFARPMQFPCMAHFWRSPARKCNLNLMQTYRVYFRHGGDTIKGRHDFDAQDEPPPSSWQRPSSKPVLMSLIVSNFGLAPGWSTNQSHHSLLT